MTPSAMSEGSALGYSVYEVLLDQTDQSGIQRIVDGACLRERVVEDVQQRGTTARSRSPHEETRVQSVRMK